MQAPASRTPLSLVPVLPPALRPWADALQPALQRLLIPGPVLDCLEAARTGGAGAPFAARLLEALDIRFALDESDLLRIPTTGAAMAVANHPYGIVEGLILAVVLDRV